MPAGAALEFSKLVFFNRRSVRQLTTKEAKDPAASERHEPVNIFRVLVQCLVAEEAKRLTTVRKLLHDPGWFENMYNVLYYAPFCDDSNYPSFIRGYFDHSCNRLRSDEWDVLRRGIHLHVGDHVSHRHPADATPRLRPVSASCRRGDARRARLLRRHQASHGLQHHLPANQRRLVPGSATRFCGRVGHARRRRLWRGEGHLSDLRQLPRLQLQRLHDLPLQRKDDGSHRDASPHARRTGGGRFP